MKPCFRYLYDGSFEGFLSCVHHFYKDGDRIGEICDTKPPDSFLMMNKKIETDQSLSNIVADAIISKLSYDIYLEVYFAFLSEEKGREWILLDYLRLAFKVGSSIQHHLTVDAVQRVRKMSRKTSRERHRMLGLLRFQKKETFLYAPIETDCYVLPVLGTHFRDRLPDEPFLIHDVGRNMALAYNTKHLILFPLEKSDPDDFSDCFELLWKHYHSNLSIAERKNKDLQRQNMPKKYWKYLPEMNEGSPDAPK